MRNSYNKEMIESAVASSMCWADVCRKLGVQPMTGSQTHVKKRACDFKIDYSHFTGSGHKKGKTYEKKDALEYCFNGSTITSHKLKNKLIRDGYKEKRCEKCKNDMWMGENIPLELHHIDSNHFNNEFKNLLILCANCHAIEDAKMGMQPNGQEATGLDPEICRFDSDHPHQNLTWMCWNWHTGYCQKVIN